MQRRIAIATACLALALAGGCSKDAKKDTTAGRSKELESSGSEADAATASRCSGADARHEVSEYDTSGDDRPDVRKVFVRVGEGSLARLVLVCRESDLNADGTKDIVRYYTDEGEALREESDRNFDGQMDEITFFEKGLIVRQEFDTQGDGKVDTKIFFDNGKPLRAERDLNARSTAQKWTPDRWEYYEEGRMVRMGTDLDGDGKVDRWDRDQSLRRQWDLGREDEPAAPETQSSGPA